MTNPYHDNLTTLAKRLKPLILKTATTASIEAVITLNAGAGLTGGGTGSNLTLALDTPGTLGASSTNSATGNHTHLIDAASDVSTPAAKILESDGSGGLTLNNLLVSGGDLTVGSNILLVDYSGTRVGINCAPDAQFDLDIAGNIRWQGWGVGKMAMTVKDAQMICHYDGPGDVRTNMTGEPNGHLGQAATISGGVVFGRGKFGKAAQIATTTTNVVPNPAFSHGTWNNGWSVTSGVLTPTQNTNPVYIYYGTSSARLAASGGNGAYKVAINVGNTNSWTISCYVFRPDLGTVSNADCTIYYGGAGASNYVNLGGGLWLVWRTVTGVASNTDTGLQVADGATVFLSGMQVEERAFPTHLAVGNMPNHSWTGTAHASSSSRSAAGLTYPAASIEAVNTMTIMFWVHPLVTGTTRSIYERVIDANNRLSIGINTSNKLTAALRVGGTADPSVTSTTTLGVGWYHVAVVITSVVNGSAAITLYVNGAEEASDTSSSTGLNLASAAVSVGNYPGLSNILNGWLDELALVRRAMPADEIRAVYESDAPIFAETSTFHFRAGGSNVWADEEGLWQRDSTGGAVLGASGVDSKSWGGFTLDSGDIVLGSNTTGKSAIWWDRSTGKFGFYGGGGATAQVEVNTSGEITFGSGKGLMGTVGLNFYDTLSSQVTQIRWYDQYSPGNYNPIGRVYADWGGGTTDPAAARLGSIKQTGDPWDYCYTAMTAWDLSQSKEVRVEAWAGGSANINYARIGGADYLHLADGLYLFMTERSTTPSNPAANTQANVYVKGDKFIIQFNNAGTIRYKYLDLTGTGVTWTHTTTAP